MYCLLFIIKNVQLVVFLFLCHCLKVSADDLVNCQSGFDLDCYSENWIKMECRIRLQRGSEECSDFKVFADHMPVKQVESTDDELVFAEDFSSDYPKFTRKIEISVDSDCCNFTNSFDNFKQVRPGPPGYLSIKPGSHDVNLSFRRNEEMLSTIEMSMLSKVTITHGKEPNDSKIYWSNDIDESTSIRIQNLTPNQNYSVRIEQKPNNSDSDRMWSKPIFRNFSTLPAVPVKTQILEAGFDIQRKADNTVSLALYWQNHKEFDRNGEKFGYIILLLDRDSKFHDYNQATKWTKEDINERLSKTDLKNVQKFEYQFRRDPYSEWTIELDPYEEATTTVNFLLFAVNDVGFSPHSTWTIPVAQTSKIRTEKGKSSVQSIEIMRLASIKWSNGSYTVYWELAPSIVELPKVKMYLVWCHSKTTKCKSGLLWKQVAIVDLEARVVSPMGSITHFGLSFQYEETMDGNSNVEQSEGIKWIQCEEREEGGFLQPSLNLKSIGTNFANVRIVFLTCSKNLGLLVKNWTLKACKKGFLSESHCKTLTGHGKTPIGEIVFGDLESGQNYEFSVTVETVYGKIETSMAPLQVVTRGDDHPFVNKVFESWFYDGGIVVSYEDESSNDWSDIFSQNSECQLQLSNSKIFSADCTSVTFGTSPIKRSKSKPLRTGRIAFHFDSVVTSQAQQSIFECGVEVSRVRICQSNDCSKWSDVIPVQKTPSNQFDPVVHETPPNDVLIQWRSDQVLEKLEISIKNLSNFLTVDYKEVFEEFLVDISGNSSPKSHGCPVNNKKAGNFSISLPLCSSKDSEHVYEIKMRGVATIKSTGTVLFGEWTDSIETNYVCKQGEETSLMFLMMIGGGIFFFVVIATFVIFFFSFSVLRANRDFQEMSLDSGLLRIRVLREIERSEFNNNVNDNENEKLRQIAKQNLYFQDYKQGETSQGLLYLPY